MAGQSGRDDSRVDESPRRVQRNQPAGDGHVCLTRIDREHAAATIRIVRREPRTNVTSPPRLRTPYPVQVSAPTRGRCRRRASQSASDTPRTPPPIGRSVSHETSPRAYRRSAESQPWPPPAVSRRWRRSMRSRIRSACPLCRATPRSCVGRSTAREISHRRPPGSGRCRPSSDPGTARALDRRCVIAARVPRRHRTGSTTVERSVRGLVGAVPLAAAPRRSRGNHGHCVCMCRTRPSIERLRAGHERIASRPSAQPGALQSATSRDGTRATTQGAPLVPVRPVWMGRSRSRPWRTWTAC
jgi:hypothetical protein